MTRPPKKSATLEIRLPHAVKEAFMARCRADDTSASDAIRGFIDAQLARPPQKEPLMNVLKPLARPSIAVAALVVAGAFVVFAAHPSRAAPDLRTMFNQLDRDHDGNLTLAEFRAAQDGDHIFLVAAPPPGAPEGPIGAGVRHVGPPPPGPVMIPFHGPPPRPPEGAQRPPPEMMQSMARREFGRMDMDADSHVTYAEFETSHRALMRSSFVALDEDENGSISAEEFSVGAPGPQNPEQRRAHSAEIMTGLDRNHDGQVSWEEFSNPAS